jgi:hypothetical protein
MDHEDAPRSATPGGGYGLLLAALLLAALLTAKLLMDGQVSAPVGLGLLALIVAVSVWAAARRARK